MNYKQHKSFMVFTGSHSRHSVTHKDQCSITHTDHSLVKLIRDQIDATTAQCTSCMIVSEVYNNALGLVTTAAKYL